MRLFSTTVPTAAFSVSRSGAPPVTSSTWVTDLEGKVQPRHCADLEVDAFARLCLETFFFDANIVKTRRQKRNGEVSALVASDASGLVVCGVRYGDASCSHHRPARVGDC